jgi:RimJ/RimL family protein N-acetyltransferase
VTRRSAFLPVVGRLVRLRDVTPDDAELIDRWNREAVGGFNDFGLPREPVSRETLGHGPPRDARGGRLIVETLDGQPVGTIDARIVQYGPPPTSNAWQIGIELGREARGRGYGTEAQRLMADWLFATTSVNRVEAATDIENVAEQRSLEKAGYRRDGVMRGAQFRAGRFHDLVYYSRLRND